MVISISGRLPGINLKLNNTYSKAALDVLCTAVYVILSTLEKLEQNLHLVGIFLEAAEQGVVSHNVFQHLGLPVVLEEALFAVRCGHQSLVQHLHSNIWTDDGNIRKQ